MRATHRARAVPRALGGVGAATAPSAGTLSSGLCPSGPRRPARERSISHGVGADHDGTLPDATPLLGSHGELEASVAHAIRDDRRSLQQHQDEPADGVDVGVIELDTELLSNLVQAGDAPSAQLILDEEDRVGRQPPASSSRGRRAPPARPRPRDRDPAP